MSLLRDGLAVGVYAAISGGRTLLTGAVSSLLADRVVLRFADPADALLAGVPVARTGGSQPAGRGLFVSPDLSTAAEIQVAMAPDRQPRIGKSLGAGARSGSGSPQVADQAAPGTDRAASGTDQAARRQWLLPALPQRLEYHQLISATPEQATTERPGARSQTQTPNQAHRYLQTQARDHAHRERSIPIGLGGDDAAPLYLDLESAPVTLLIGPPGSGRSSTLRCIAEGLRRCDAPVLMVSGVDHSDARLAAVLSEHPGATVLVDDVQPADALSGDGAEVIGELLAAHVGSGRSPTEGAASARSRFAAGTGRLVIASSAADVMAAYRGPLALARTARSGVILGSSTPGDGEVFGLRLSRRPPGPPGRALLVQAGRCSPIQLSLPPPAGHHVSLAETPNPSGVRMHT
jgi:S-DNA-T family DNA segregation ATPase FtsK/SpoIIIE